MGIKNMRCKLFGHDWRYNFPSMPNKRICASCKERQKLNLASLEWEKNNFEDKRTDEQLIKAWF